MKVLCWVTFAYEPLEVKTLQQAVAIDPTDTEFDQEAITIESILISVCAGLVIVNEHTTTVRLVRESTSF